MAALAITTLLAVTACNNSAEDEPMDADLTRAQAQAQVIANLTDSLSLLPPQAALSRRYPISSTGQRFGPGTLTPCTSGAPRPDTPVSYGVKYWVTGVDNDAAGANVGELLRGWKERGWETKDRPEGTTRSAAAGRPDGYTIVANINKYGDISLTGTSPCFPPPPQGERPDARETIEHP